jgi:hypothetical protein
MPSLTAVQKSIPSAHTSCGRVLAFHEGKHHDLGEYVGDDAVALNLKAEQLLAAIEQAKVEAEVEVAAAEPVKKKGKNEASVSDVGDLSAGLGAT